MYQLHTKNENGCVSCYYIKHYLDSRDSNIYQNSTKFNLENSYTWWKAEKNSETKLTRRFNAYTQTSRKSKGKRANFNKGGKILFKIF